MPLEELAKHADEIATELEAGRTLKFLKAGKRIAEIAPYPPEVNAERREAARRKFQALMDAGLDWGGPYTHDERHER